MKKFLHKLKYFYSALCILNLGVAITYSPIANAINNDSKKTLEIATGVPLNSDDSIPDEADISTYMNELEEMKRNKREALVMIQELETIKLRTELMNLRGGAQREGASPYVIALMGVNKNRQARIMVPSYGEMTVRKGDTLPGNWRVVNITNQTVIVQQGDSERLQLPFFAH